MIRTNSLEEIILSAGDIIKKYFYEDINDVRVEYKQDKTPVTIADEETNVYLKDNLLKLFPEAGWLSEEDKDSKERMKKEYVWIVDPLDGTQSFVNREPDLAISVALVKNGVPFVSAVYNPISKQGGFSNNFDKEIKFIGFDNIKKENHELENSSILVSNSEFKSGIVDSFVNTFKSVKPVGSVANKLMKVAAGEHDFYYSVYAKSEWDIAGGIGLLNATGKGYERFDRKGIIFNNELPIIDSGSVAGNATLINDFFEKYQHLAKTKLRV